MSRRFSYWFVGVIVAYVTYVVTWTWISLERFYQLRATVFDLGIYSEWGWRIYSIPLSPSEWLGTVLNVGGTVFLCPTTLGGYPTILAAQSCAIGSGAIVLYLIARQYRLRPPVAFVVSAAYLLYFPVSGINFTDAHYEAYLIPLFLVGFWLYLEGRYRLSFVFLLLAGDIRYPFGVYPLLFGIQLLIPDLAGTLAGWIEAGAPTSRLRRFCVSSLHSVARQRFIPSRAAPPRWYAYGLPFAAAALLVGGSLTNQLWQPNASIAQLIHTNSIGLWPNLSVKAWSLILLLAPLAFLPVLAPRWLLLCLPFFGLMFFVNYFGYTYPYIVTSWYTILVVPFLWLAALDGVAKLGEHSSWIHVLARAVRRVASKDQLTLPASVVGKDALSSPGWNASVLGVLRREVPRPRTIALTGVIVLTAVTAGFFAPYGPGNASTSANFHFSAFGSTNRTFYDEFEKLASFIPASDPAVLLQDNMPELLPRPLLPGAVNPLVVGPFPTVAYNFTRQLPNGSWVPINPDYVIADPVSSPYNFFDTTGAYPYNISMEQAVSELYATYNYGIVGEASEMLLLKHYYTGPLLYYVPYSANFPASSFTSQLEVSGSPACGASCLLVTDDTGGQTAWYGPYAYLSPGTYEISIHLGIADWTPSDEATIQVTGEFGHLLLNSTVLSDLTAGAHMAPIFLNTTVFVGNGTPAVEFRAIESHFQGNLALYGVTVHEVAPPSSVYRVGDTPHDTAIYDLLKLVPSGSTVVAEPSLRPYFHNLTLDSIPASGPVPAAQFQIYDPAIPSECSSPSNRTLCAVVSGDYASGAYSILAQDDGVTLLARSPVASLEVYSPLEENVSTAQLITEGSPGQDFTNRSGNNLTVTNQTNGAYAWYGPYASLPPGTYEAQFELSVSNNSPLDHMVLQVTGEAGQVVLAARNLTGSSFAEAGMLVAVNVSFDLSSFMSTIEFVGSGVDWTGIITLTGVSLEETAPPS